MRHNNSYPIAAAAAAEAPPGVQHANRISDNTTAREYPRHPVTIPWTPRAAELETINYKTILITSLAARLAVQREQLLL